MLYIVSTPIGNLEDITYRAVRTLHEADVIVCEDTRKTKILLDRYEITGKKLESFHGHSSPAKADHIVQLASEQDVALVSDAGTPGISDPGYILIQKAIEAGVDISPIPGASAVLSGLVGSGMHMHHFLYLGFLPLKKGRQTLFKSLQNKKHTVVIYESVHRIQKTLSDIETYFGADHQICVARELTKKFETYHRGTVAEIQAYFNANKPKWEFVVIF